MKLAIMTASCVVAETNKHTPMVGCLQSLDYRVVDWIGGIDYWTHSKI